VAVLLALATSVVYGTADFLGGLAARSANALVVVAVSQLAGLALVLALAAPLGGHAGPADLAWGAAAGSAGALALTLFYRTLATGSMSVVAPVTAVCAAAVPVVAGLALGDIVSVPALAGVAIALPAVGLVARERSDVREVSLGLPSLVGALLAGTGFGLVFLFLHQTSPGSGLWPLVAARAASALVVGSVLVVRRVPVRVPRATMPLVLGAGIFDMGANILFLLAVRHGQLSIVGVLSSLYPVSTVVLATVLLRERMTRVQLAGVGGCALAVALIAWP
jgi:drug/metabolite transporter (DMT)-like permease